MTSVLFNGKKVVYLGHERFDPELIPASVAKIDIEERTVEFDSQAGKYSVPTGAYSKRTFEFNLIIPNLHVLARVFPSLYHEASFKDKLHPDDPDYTHGHIQIGGDNCVSAHETMPLVIHNVCDADSSQDIYVPKALVSTSISLDIKTSDPFEIKVNVSMLDTPNGFIIFGDGSLSEPTLYDPVTMTYKPIDKSSNLLKAGTTASNE